MLFPEYRPAPFREEATQSRVAEAAAEALAHMADPGNCLSVLKEDICAMTTTGHWTDSIPSQAEDPFQWDPPLIFKVMGA